MIDKRLIFCGARIAWPDVLLKVLKESDVRLITYVPDNVLTPLISGVHADNYFMPVCATREDEAIGMAGGNTTYAIRSSEYSLP